MSRRATRYGSAFEPPSPLRRIRRALAVLVGLIVIGTLGYLLLGGWTVLDALYMTVIAIASVGFEEVRDLDNDPAGRVWTILLIISAVITIAYVASALVQTLVEGTVTGYFRRRKMSRMIADLEGHYLVCGFGRVGREVARELSGQRVPFVVIDRDEAAVAQCHALGYVALHGDASDDPVLEEAGVTRASALVTAVASDADNVFVVLSARRANPKLHIVARAESEQSAKKLTTAGANRTLSPYAEGGKRLARLAVQPSVVDYLDVVAASEHDLELRLEELTVRQDSPLANRTLAELKTTEDASGARIVAIKHRDENFNITLSPDDRIQPGDSVIVLGRPEQVAAIEGAGHS